MINAIYGKKIGMTQIFDEAGKVIPVTVVEAGPCVVIQKKTTENDGYDAVQLGYGDVTTKHVTKPMQGHFAKADVAAKKTLKEFRLADCAALNVGDVVKADTFAVGDSVDVSGTSKGKGYAGAIKRHHFSSNRASHGNSVSTNAPGSIGNRQDPGRVFPGKRMAGHLGDVQRTTQNLVIARVDADRQLILVRGAVPGCANGEVIIRPAVKAKA